jgi:hypothetical protein
MARQGAVGHGMAGKAGHGLVRQGAAWHGMAGKAGHG